LESVINTDRSWRVFTNPASTPITGFGGKLHTYIVVGPGDDVEGSPHPWDWADPAFDDQHWSAASSLRNGAPRGISTDGKWLLVPRQFPLMEEIPIRLKYVRRAEGVDATDAFLAGNAPLTIPAHSTAPLLLDQGEITTAFPERLTSGGRGSSVKLTYAKALNDGPLPSDKPKSHRDIVEGKFIRGFEDVFRPDGGTDSLSRPLRWRT
jgi:alpha-L-rhamnosidase